jgi:hypothetical protein
MRNELRYQAKIHAISNMPIIEKIKFLAFSPPFFLKIKTIKTSYMKKNIIRLACKARSNL